MGGQREVCCPGCISEAFLSRMYISIKITHNNLCINMNNIMLVLSILTVLLSSFMIDMFLCISHEEGFTYRLYLFSTILYK